MTREKLPNRRQCETLEFEHDGIAWSASWSRYIDGRLAEVFLAGPKVGTGLRITAHDSAILTSVALQHGADAETLRSALLRSPVGAPASVVARALDLIETDARPSAGLSDGQHA